MTRPSNIFSLLTLIVVMTSCGGTSNDDATEPLVIDIVAQQFIEGAINFGSIANRQERLDVCFLAVKQINDVGGVLGKELNSIGFVASTTAQSNDFVQKLVDADIQAFEIQFSSRAVAAAGITVPAGRVLMASTAQSTSLTDIMDNDLVYRFQPRTDTVSIALAELAIAKGGTKAAVIFNDDDEFGISISEEFAKAFTELGGEIVATITFPISKSSGFDSEIITLEDSGADVIVNNMTQPSLAANFYNEARSLDFIQLVNLTGSFSGVGTFLLDNLINPLDIDGLSGVQSPRGLQTDENVQFFQNTHVDQYGTLPGAFTYGVYDACHILGLANERAGRENSTDSPTGLMIRDSLRAVMNPPGEVVGATTLSRAFEVLRNGGEIDFNGTYARQWDVNGDLIGDMTFDVSFLDGFNVEWVTTEQIIINLESN